ncbi:MAG TPA: efflux RND transporter periplasmic adaptor subunit [Vicinamibacterales bacterium]|nr:efflux RND transporter periplasmic adaptor subunit [Vicinamibacterales bacterium]
MTTASVVQKSMPVEIGVIGSAEPVSTVSIRSQTTGQLMSVNFTEGDEVTKGQLLFAIDKRPLEAALEQAQANLARDEASAANAAATTKRFQDLADRGIAARADLDTSKASLSALNATVAADRAAIENAKVQLEYATINAPLTGRTGALMVHEGNLVRANDSAALVVINQIMPIQVAFSIPEARLPELKRFMARGALRVLASPPNDDAPPAVGRISFIDNSVDPATGTIKVKGTFPNADRRLWPGQYVNVTVELTTEKNATVVSTQAVQAGQQGPFVFVVKPDQTVELRNVIVTRTAAAETVIASGLEPGETVVTDGQLRLVPGSKISVKGQDARDTTRSGD